MNSQTSTQRLVMLAFITLLSAVPNAHAGWGCPRFFSALPNVAALSVESGQVRFKRSNDINFDKGACSENVPEINLTQQEYINLHPNPSYPDYYPDTIEQAPTSCTRVGSLVYFGIAFYGGEGSGGVGGVGRLDLHTGKVDVRRPQLLRTTSVDKLFVIDKSVWVTTKDYSEGTTGPGIGIARYDWVQDRLDTFQGNKDGPCGMWANDMLVHDGELWVATELGISRYSLKHGTWRHFVPINATSQDLRETSCHEIYQAVASHLSATPEKMDDVCDLNGGPPRDIFRHLLQEHRPTAVTSINWSDSKHTMLDWAGSRNDVVDVIPAAGANVNAKDDQGWSILMKAAYAGDADIVRALLARGAEVNAQNPRAGTALIIAAEQGRAEVVSILMDHGADATLKGPTGGTALSIAASRGHTAVVEAILAKARKVDPVDLDGSDALVNAAGTGDVVAVAALLAKGIDVNALSTNGDSALGRAAANGHAEMIRALVAKGANVNARNRVGFTALMFAALQGQSETARALLSAGADPNSTDGTTALSLAVTWRHPEIEQLLRNARAVK